MQVKNLTIIVGYESGKKKSIRAKFVFNNTMYCLPNCYKNGQVQYDCLSNLDTFKDGLARLQNGLKNHCIALMCSEKDPIMCHRMILICRHLKSENLQIYHILEDGKLESNREAERRLMKLLKIPELSLFEKPEELIKSAYDKQGEKIAFKTENSEDFGL